MIFFLLLKLHPSIRYCKITLQLTLLLFYYFSFAAISFSIRLLVDSHARATMRKIYQFVPVSIYPSFLRLIQAIIKSFTLETPLEVNQIKTTLICPLPLTYHFYKTRSTLYFLSFSNGCPGNIRKIYLPHPTPVKLLCFFLHPCIILTPLRETIFPLYDLLARYN